jgi:hypothetical protein
MTRIGRLQEALVECVARARECPSMTVLLRRDLPVFKQMSINDCNAMIDLVRPAPIRVLGQVRQ